MVKWLNGMTGTWDLRAWPGDISWFHPSTNQLCQFELRDTLKNLEPWFPKVIPVCVGHGDQGIDCVNIFGFHLGYRWGGSEQRETSKSLDIGITLQLQKYKIICKILALFYPAFMTQLCKMCKIKIPVGLKHSKSHFLRLLIAYLGRRGRGIDMDRIESNAIGLYGIIKSPVSDIS